MKRSLHFALATGLLVSAASGTALAFPIPPPGTECLPVIVTGTDEIIATYQGNSALFSNDLYLVLDKSGIPGDDGDASNDLFIFNNHESPVGGTKNLGAFPIGTELIFRLHVRNTGKDWLTGPASRNPDDGRCHARVQSNWRPDETLVAFEDHLDFQYNDLSFSFTNTSTIVLTCPAGTGQVNVAYSSAFEALGGAPPHTFSIIEGGLPDGLSLDEMTGVVAGAPTTAGLFGFMARVVDTSDSSAVRNCQITVAPTVQFNPVGPLCMGADPIDLNGYVSPPGGAFTGPGIAGSLFDPATAGVGDHIITYTFDGVDAPQTITVLPLPTVTFDQVPALPADAGATDLSAYVSPPGGTFSGSGLVGSSFDPATAGVGIHVVTYTYTDENGCSDSASQSIIVNAPPCATADSLTCLAGRPDDFSTSDGPEPTAPSAAVLSLLQGVPGGAPIRTSFDDSALNGYFVHSFANDVCGHNAIPERAVLSILMRGSGSQANTDYIYLAVDGVVLWGLSMNTLQSVHTQGSDTAWNTGDEGRFVLDLGNLPSSDSNPSYGPRYPSDITSVVTELQQGELDIVIADDTNVDHMILVFHTCANMTVTFNPVAMLCVDADPIDLSEYVSPQGGTFTGPGIDGSMFDPALAGAGGHVITYTYEGDSKEQTIRVNSLPSVTFNPVGALCVDSDAINLGGHVSPAGGTFTGPGIDGTMFDPATAGVGNHLIVYMFTDANGCADSAPQTIVVQSGDVCLPPLCSITGPDTLCVGEPLELCGPQEPAGRNFSYLWTAPDGSTLIESEQCVTIPIPYYGIYTLVVTDVDSGVESDPCIHRFKVAKPPPCAISGPETAFMGTRVEFYGVAGNFSYVWTLPDGSTQNTRGITIASAQLSDAGTYTLVVTDLATGCEGVPCEQQLAVEPMISAQTPAGSDVEVQLLAAATVTFEQVMVAGTTFLSFLAISGLPADLVAVGGEALEITSTATHMGALGLAMSYDESGLQAPEEALKLLRYDMLSGNWVEITTGVDVASNTIMGSCGGLSSFVVAAPVVGVAADEPVEKLGFGLRSIYPNPTSGRTTIHYALTRNGSVQLTVHDVQGRQVATLDAGVRSAGEHARGWDGRAIDGRKLAAGIYVIRLESREGLRTRKMVLMN